MISLRQILIKNTTWLALSEMVTLGILFIITVIIARTLGDTVYGKFAFILAFVQLWQVLAEFGLNIIAIRELSNHKNELKHYLNNFLSIKLIVSILTFLAIIITVQFLNKSEIIKNLIYIAGAYIVFYTLAEFLRSVFRAEEKFKYESYIKISQHLILLCLVLISIYLSSLYLIMTSYLISALYGTIITLIIIWKKFSHFKFEWDKKLIKYIIKESWPMALANIFVVVYFRIDTVMLSLLKGDQPTAWYNAAYLLIFSLSFIPYILMNSLYPSLTQTVKSSLPIAKRMYRQSLIIIILGSLIILGIANSIINELIPFIYGPQFKPAVNIFYILSLAVFFAYASHVWLYTLNALGRQKIYMIAAGIGMLINLTLNYIFIPAYSYSGAAWATVITEAIIAIIIFIGCEMSFKLKKVSNDVHPPPLSDQTI